MKSLRAKRVVKGRPARCRREHDGTGGKRERLGWKLIHYSNALSERMGRQLKRRVPSISRKMDVSFSFRKLTLSVTCQPPNNLFFPSSTAWPTLLKFHLPPLPPVSVPRFVVTRPILLFFIYRSQSMILAAYLFSTSVSTSSSGSLLDIDIRRWTRLVSSFYIWIWSRYVSRIVKDFAQMFLSILL